jgi:hypothetical protein
MILIIDSYTYNDGGILKGDYYQHLFYISNGKIYEKRKRFLVEPNSFLSEHEKFPTVYEVNLERIMRLFNPVFFDQKKIIEYLEDQKIHKFYRKYGEIIYKGIIEKIEWF